MSLGALRERLARRRADLRSLRITVLAGGSSHEREISITSGTAVARALHEHGYAAQLLSIDSDDISMTPLPLADTPELPGATGASLARDSSEMSLVPLLRQTGMIFTTLHGTRGEDGVWQGLLELLGVPYVSAAVRGSALAMHKLTAKRLFQQLGVPTPRYWVHYRGADTRAQIPPEVRELVAKPVDQGSSVGIELVDHDDAGWQAIAELSARFDPLLIEQRIHGRELTAGVIGPAAAPVALPLVEIRPRREFYDYTAKYTKGQTEYLCPAQIEPEVAARIQAHALAVYREFDLEPYARVDFILDEAGVAYCLEANTLPGFTPLSLLPQAARAAGIDFAELLELLMLCALERNERRSGGTA